MAMGALPYRRLEDGVAYKRETLTRPWTRVLDSARCMSKYTTWPRT